MAIQKSQIELVVELITRLKGNIRGQSFAGCSFVPNLVYDSRVGIQVEQIADFSNCDATSVDFSNIEGCEYAKFEGSNLDGAIFGGTTKVRPEQFINSKNVENAKFNNSNMLKEIEALRKSNQKKSFSETVVESLKGIFANITIEGNDEISTPKTILNYIAQSKNSSVDNDVNEKNLDLKGLTNNKLVAPAIVKETITHVERLQTQNITQTAEKGYAASKLVENRNNISIS
jgi:uncharacterized protein YjbI with pentapeptide repeats